MKCPSKEQVEHAARIGTANTREVLKTLFPEVFEGAIKAGQIYQWGSASDGGSCVVVKVEGTFSLINFHKGFCYATGVPLKATKTDLVHLLNHMPRKLLHNCYTGSLAGPVHFKSWCTK